MNIGCFLDDAAKQDPLKPYLYYQDTCICYSEFAETVAKAAQGFLNLGIRKGDRVCLLLPNSPEFLYAWLGLAKIGAISVFVNTALQENEIKYIANHSEAVAILAASSFLEKIEKIAIRKRPHELPAMQYPLICAGREHYSSTLSFPDMMQSASPCSGGLEVAADDVATFIYTSGTTGLPKAVMQTHKTYVLTGQAFPSWLGLTEQDRLFTCLPLFHINAQAYSVMGSLGRGASLILSEKFSAGSFWDQLKKYRATQFNLIGAMPQILLKQPEKQTDREHRARAAYSAPALRRPEHEEFEKRFGVTLTIGYGLSESTFGCINPVEKGKRQIGSMGLPRSHPEPEFANHLKITGDQGEELKTGEVGEIALKNPTVMKGYYKDPEATQAVLQDGWLFTGDLAYRDRAGFLYFAGRKKDMIRLKGENVSAYEVESVIDQYPGVLESAVIGIPAEFGEEQIVAYVAVKPGSNGLSRNDLVEWCKTQLAGFKVPTVVEFRDSLPKTPTKKIAKHLLREESL